MGETLPHWKYDVFVSFVEDNTCVVNFTDQIFSALDQKGITHFGKSFTTLEAIEASRFSIIVFSKTFASNSRCLQELVKVVECTNVKGQIAFPVFYDVKPSDVRYQKGSYGGFFQEYAESLGREEEAQKCRQGFLELANLYGWVLQDRHESELIQEIATSILNKLNDSTPPSTSVNSAFKETESHQTQPFKKDNEDLEFQRPRKLLDMLVGCLLPGQKPKSLGFTLPPSLSGLLSLKELNLSDCNLFDESLPSDLVRISTLKKLNLSRNHFITLPNGISQLSQLQSLELEYCKKLEGVPELPSSIEDLRTFNCWSLKALSTPLDVSVAKHREFMLNNCFELVRNNEEQHVTLRILKTHLLSLLRHRLLSLFYNYLKWAEFQGDDNSGVKELSKYIKEMMEVLYKELNGREPNIPELTIFVSGTEIPEWFIFQTGNPSVAIDLPPNWSSNGMMMGLAICGLFEVRDDDSITCTGYSPPGVKHFLPAGYSYNFSFSLLSDKRGHTITSKYQSFKREDLAISDHMWMFYLPFDEYLHKNNWQYVEAHFKCEGPGISFKRCGIRMVYMSEVVELNQEIIYGGLKVKDFKNLANILAQFVTSAISGLKVYYTPNEQAQAEGPSGTSSQVQSMVQAEQHQ
ncbi:hypothetical protein ACFE04_025528 [Oxalis oulophora]